MGYASGLLNGLQTRGARPTRRAQDEFCSRAEEQFPHRALAWHHAEGRASMRPQKSLQCGAYPFPDGRDAWAVAGALARLFDAFMSGTSLPKAGAPVQTTLMLSRPTG